MVKDYTVRISARAKRARLVVSMTEGLVVVVPKRFDRRRIPALLESKQAWLERTIDRVRSQRTLMEPLPESGLPERLSLRALGEEWAVIYAATGSTRVTARDQGEQCLTVSGNVSNVAECRDAIRRWLSRKARERLSPQLESLAVEMGLGFTRATVRMQKTRWGSCSHQGTISLNLKLLFLPEPLARYVLVHELCHRLQMDHSSKFWDLVERREPLYRQNEPALRSAFRYIPVWLESR